MQRLALLPGKGAILSRERMAPCSHPCGTQGLRCSAARCLLFVRIIIIRLLRQDDRQPVLIHRNRLELESRHLVLAVDLLLDGGVDLSLADVLVHRVVGKAEVVLVRLAGQAVGRRLDEEALGQTQLRAQRDDLLGCVHAERRERAALSP